MKITTFNPQIITKDMEPVIKLFEELGFEKAHKKEGVGEYDVTGIQMRDPNGFKLDMMTLSEGVETQEAVDFLREAGCGRLQGYFYGKPMPYEDIIAKIEDGTYRYAGAEKRA